MKGNGQHETETIVIALHHSTIDLQLHILWIVTCMAYCPPQVCMCTYQTKAGFTSSSRMFPAAPQRIEEEDPLLSEPWFIDTFFHTLASVLHSARNNPCHLAALQKQAADYGALRLMVVSAATLAEKNKEASDADDVASTYTWQASYMTTSVV
jgi:hypothetical protein